MIYNILLESFTFYRTSVHLSVYVYKNLSRNVSEKKMVNYRYDVSHLMFFFLLHCYCIITAAPIVRIIWEKKRRVNACKLLKSKKFFYYAKLFIITACIGWVNVTKVIFSY